jgi:hypothetical protein
MSGFSKAIVAAAFVVGSMTAASAAPERTIRDNSGVLHVQDQYGVWHRSDRTQRIPGAARIPGGMYYTLEEERSFQRHGPDLD